MAFGIGTNTKGADAGFQDLHTGKFTEVMLIRDNRDMDLFLEKQHLWTEYQRRRHLEHDAAAWGTDWRRRTPCRETDECRTVRGGENGAGSV